MSKRSPGESWGSLLFAENIGAAYERPVRLRRKALLNCRFQPEASKASLRKPRDDRAGLASVGCAIDTDIRTLSRQEHLQSYRQGSELQAVNRACANCLHGRNNPWSSASTLPSSSVET